MAPPSREGVDDVLRSVAISPVVNGDFSVATTTSLLTLLADFSSKTTVVFRGLVESSSSAQQRLANLSQRAATAGKSIDALELSSDAGTALPRNVVRAGFDIDSGLAKHLEEEALQVPSGPWRTRASTVPTWATSIQAHLDRCPPFPNLTGIGDYR